MCALWAYRNTPHESTGEKPSFLLFGRDLRGPTEAAFLKPTNLITSTAEDYQEEGKLSLSSPCELAIESIRKVQSWYKKSYDRDTRKINYRVGDWIFIRFPAEETGQGRKLSNPWHGPYWIVSRRDPDVTATKVYFPEEPQVQVHQQWVTRCPPHLVTGYYWYGPKKHSTGGAPRSPRWVEDLQKGVKPNVETNLDSVVDMEDAE